MRKPLVIALLAASMSSLGACASGHKTVPPTPPTSSTVSRPAAVQPAWCTDLRKFKVDSDGALLAGNMDQAFIDVAELSTDDDNNPGVIQVVTDAFSLAEVQGSDATALRAAVLKLEADEAAALTDCA